MMEIISLLILCMYDKNMNLSGCSGTVIFSSDCVTRLISEAGFHIASNCPSNFVHRRNKQFFVEIDGQITL